MKTVEYYKSIGVVFVEGDQRLNSNNESLTMNACGVERANNQTIDDGKQVIGFAWREAGTYPDEHPYPVELDCEFDELIAIGTHDRKGDLKLLRWRPSI